MSTMSDYFDCCPQCGNDPFLMNVGKNHYMVCRSCRVRWFLGQNLFSGWLHESKAVWRANRKFLKGCRPVEHWLM
jgi:hypothetical protein